MKNKNIFWGLVFLTAAAFVLLNSFGYFSELSITKIIFTVLLVCCILTSLRPINFFGILVPIALLIIMYDDLLESFSVSVSSFSVLAAAILGSIGLSFLFPDHRSPDGFQKHGHNAFAETADHVSDSDVNCSVSFSGTTKYIDTPDFRRGYFKCSFGSLKVFFDHAKITADSAEIFIDNSFGETDLYLPKEWNVKLEMTASFGDIKEIHKITNVGLPVVTVRGNVSFGDCKIYYI